MRHFRVIFIYCGATVITFCSSNKREEVRWSLHRSPDVMGKKYTQHLSYQFERNKTWQKFFYDLIGHLIGIGCKNQLDISDFSQLATINVVIKERNKKESPGSFFLFILFYRVVKVSLFITIGTPC